jgi:hypothetical protein
MSEKPGWAQFFPSRLDISLEVLALRFDYRQRLLWL